MATRPGARTRQGGAATRPAAPMPDGYDLLIDPEHQRLVTQVDGIAEKQGQTAVILERLTNYFQDHDRRIQALEAQPAQQRASVFSDRQLLFMFGSFIVSLTALIASLAPHLSFR